MCPKDIYYIRLESGEKLTLNEVLNQIRSDPSQAKLLKEFLWVSEEGTKYISGEANPDSDPLAALGIFFSFMHKGFYPPASILKWIASAIEVAFLYDQNRPAIEEKLGISGIKHIKNRLLSFRDSRLSYDFHILTTHFGFSQEKAGNMIINKYRVEHDEDIPAGPMYRCLIKTIGMPDSARRIAMIYQEQRRKTPADFGEVPEDFDEEKFLITFNKNDLKTIFIE